MNYLKKFRKINRFYGKKRKINNFKSLTVITVVGMAIGGAIVAIFTKCCCSEIKNIVIKNVEDIDGNIDENIDANLK